MMVHVVHELKTDPTSFFRIYHGDKTFDVRLDDRGFQAGDILLLREYDPTRCQLHILHTNCPAYTGASVYKRIGFVAKGKFYGLELGRYAILSLINVSEEEVGKSV